MEKPKQKPENTERPKSHPGKFTINEIRARVKHLVERINTLIVIDGCDLNDLRSAICSSPQFRELIENESEPTLNLDMEILAEALEIVFNQNARCKETQDPLYDELERLNDLLKRTGEMIETLFRGSSSLYFKDFPTAKTRKEQQENLDREMLVDDRLRDWCKYKVRSKGKRNKHH